MTSQDKTTQDPDIESPFLLGSGRIDQALKRVRLARVAALSAVLPFLPRVFLVVPAQTVFRRVVELLM